MAEFRKLYMGKDWRAIRRARLEAEPLCRACHAGGDVVVAIEVDHIVPHRGDLSLFLDFQNTQPLCKRCHSKKTQAGQ